MQRRHRGLHAHHAVVGATGVCRRAMHVATLVLATALPLQLEGQTARPARVDTSSARRLRVALDVMRSARYCALITVAADGRAVARTVDPLPPDSAGVVWIATNPKSRKVEQIRRDPRVTLHYFDLRAQAYVSVQGSARLVTNDREKSRHWKADWAPHYPDRSKGLLLIEVVPSRMEVVSVRDGVVGDPVTWEAPALSFPRPPPR